MSKLSRKNRANFTKVAVSAIPAMIVTFTNAEHTKYRLLHSFRQSLCTLGLRAYFLRIGAHVDIALNDGAFLHYQRGAYHRAGQHAALVHGKPASWRKPVL